MKRLSLFIALVVYATTVHAQWTTGPVDISNTNTGNVGIKTTTPTHTLTIGSGGNGIAQYNTADQTVNYERVRQYWGSNIFTISTEYSGTGVGRAIQLSAGTSDFTVNTSNVGTPVGGVFNFNRNTTSKTLLGVTGTISGSSTANLVSVFNTVNQTGAGGYRGIWVSPYEQAIGTGSKLLIDAGTNSAENGTGTHTSRFAVTSSGEVGIGTTSPTQQLDVQKAFAAGDVAIRVANLAPGGLDASTASVIFASNGTPRNAGRIVSGRAGSYNSATSADSYMAFFTALDDVDTERMRIAGNGNIGIGTSTPSLRAGYSGISTNNSVNGGFIDFLKGGVLKGYICGDDGGLNLFAPSGQPLRLWADGSEKMTVLANGNVGIGTSVPDEMLSVVGTVHAKAVKVNLTNLPDYVFGKDYKLMPLGDIKNYIDVNHHLPEVPSATEVEKNGLDLGEMNKLLLKKIEELTLHLIEKDKQLNLVLERLEKLEKARQTAQ